MTQAQMLHKFIPWDRTGKLKAKRTPSNHRYYTEEDF